MTDRRRLITGSIVGLALVCPVWLVIGAICVKVAQALGWL